MLQISLSTIVLSLACALSGVAQAADVTAVTPARAEAICTDVRTHVTEGVLTRYSGVELVTQIGDDVAVKFLADGLEGSAGATIHYERITRKDATDFGFRIEPGMSVFMLHGDEGLPSEYVILPLHMASAPAHFLGAYGSSNEAGEYDVRTVVTMNCTLR